MEDARKLLTIILAGLVMFNCDSESEKVDVTAGEKPVADFEYLIQGGCNTDTLTVLFFNESKNSDSFQWNFGDGTTSNDTNPTKVYAESGSYLVTLTAKHDREITIKQSEILIPVNSYVTGAELSLSFKRINVTNLTVEFTISPNDHEYTLHFGDGETLKSNATQVNHTYSGLGNFEASVMVENGLGWNCASVLIDLHP